MNLPDPGTEYSERVLRLMTQRRMTREAACTVVNASMYGIGCTEGRVREEQQKRIDAGEVL